MPQKHLNKTQTVNLGSFYTPDYIIDIAYKMFFKFLKKNEKLNLNDFILLDSSCGYGSFLKIPTKYKNSDFNKKIGVDIDKEALEIAKNNFMESKNPPLFLHKNSLINISRKKFNIGENEKLIIVGNPPYNDKTSIVQNRVKNKDYSVDSSLKCRDLGMSFLLSFNELKADYICILHPLSYIIKETNFKALKRFFENYKIVDSFIISSQIFCPNSLGFFPIIIALYERNEQRIDYNFIRNYKFKTIDNKKFCLNDFDFIAKYIDKYPNKNRVSDKVAMFYTMRDINALRRSKTFIKKDCANAVYISKSKYSLYCYVDVFKQIISTVPYYFGNCDIMIDYNKFKKIESDFIKASESKTINNKILNYFENLLGEHYAS